MLSTQKWKVPKKTQESYKVPKLLVETERETITSNREEIEEDFEKIVLVLEHQILQYLISPYTSHGENKSGELCS